MSDGRLNFKATIDDADFNRKLNNMEKGVDGLKFDAPTKSLDGLNKKLLETKQRLQESKNELQRLNAQISTTAPGAIQNNLLRERNALRRSINEDKAAVIGYKQEITNLNRELGNTAKKSKGLKGVFTTIASYFGVFAGIQTAISLIRGAFKTIVDFDSRLLNVSKTTGLAGQELKNLGVSLRNLSQELKVISVDKLAEFAGVAGQLGIKGTQEILAFTEALAKLSVTSNIQGEEGAIQIARFLGLVEGDVKNVKDLGDELTNLGNNFKVFEDEIIKNALAIAQNTGTFKLGRQEILAYATSLKEAGVEAELTGASLGRTYQQIEKVLRTGKNIDNLAKITGQSVEDLKTAFNTDPQGVVYSFIKGLNEVQKAGGSVNNAITSIGITATRDLRVIGTLATGGFDVLNRAMNDVKDSSGAMQQEFETASGKISNSIESVKVSWENLILSINTSENTIGNFVIKFLKGVADMINGITRLSNSWKTLWGDSREKGEVSGYQDMMELYEDFDKYENSRNSALKARQKLMAKERDLQKEIADLQKEAEGKKPTALGTLTSHLTFGFLGSTQTANEAGKLNQKIEELNGQLGNTQGRIKAVDELFENYNGTTKETVNTIDDVVELTKEEIKARESALKKRLAFLDELQKAENDLTLSTLSGLDLELAKVEEVYQNRLKKAKELKANQEALNKIESLRVREIETVTYKADTEALKTSLEQQKKDYEDFENFKKQVGVQKATEMYSDIIDTSKSYYDVLRDELANFGDRDDLTNVEKQRINELFKLLQDYNIAKVEADRKSLEDLINSTQTAQERILVIQQEFAKKREQIESIADENIRNERLKVLEEQERQATLVVENEIYERNKTERDLIRQLTTYTKRELNNRIKSTEEFLLIAGENLSENQRKILEGELSLLNALNGSTDLIIRQNALLKEKERITKAIKNNTSKDPEIAKKLNGELEEVNMLLNDNNKKLFDTNDYINMAVQSANMLTDAFGGTNKELDRAVKTISNLVTSIAQGNMAGAVLTVVDWLIQGVKDVFGKNDTSERDAQRRKNQEEYNRMLREQLLIETRINDAYQSRVEAIKEEQDALLKNRKVIIDRMKEILNLFNSYLNSTQALANFDFSEVQAWERLGLNEYFKDGVELSDELLNKLIQLNAIAPLEGQLKDLYDELMRLRDEFGSVDEAVKQLEKELKDRLTGTTAQALADSIRDGIASGKRSFADFADDIEGFLRNAILSGMSTAIIEPQIQQLQDMLYEMMKDGVLTEEERRKFEEEYARIAEEAGKYLDLINQAGVNIGGLDDFGAGAKDGIKRITESQADRLTGILTGMQVDVIESRKSLQISNNLLSSSLDNLIAIEFNTRATADNTYQLVQILQNNQQKALGL